MPTTAAYLTSLPSIRDRCGQVFDLIVKGKSDHWDYHPEHLDTVVDYCASLIEVSPGFQTQL